MPQTDERTYQEDFHATFAGIRNREKRIRRAEKILLVIQRHISKDLRNSICVDVGCSAGVITARLADKFQTTIGIDYDRTGLAAIEQQDKVTAHFTRSDALYMPFADNSIDFVTCAQVYEHVPDDTAMVAEIYRILQPGGYCFFSGPNWLFPIEPHFFLPFLHWLPESIADRYLQLSGQGIHYYERSRTLWGLKELFHQFEIEDITIDVLLNFYLSQRLELLTWILKQMPAFVWKFMLPFIPNFNWVLRKPIS